MRPRLLADFRLGVAILVVSIATSWAAGQEKVNWRNIVRTKIPADMQIVALEHKVLLLKDGNEIPVDGSNHTFTLGDQFRIEITAEDDLYLYAITEGPTGDKTWLIPDSAERAPFVKKGETIKLPGDGYFEFSSPPGTERFVVVASKQENHDLTELAKKALADPAQPLPAGVEKKIDQTFQSVSGAREKGPKIRGVKSRGDKLSAEVSKLVQEVKRMGIMGTIEDPPTSDQSSAFAMAISSKGARSPEIYLNVVLKSGKAQAKR